MTEMTEAPNGKKLDLDKLFSTSKRLEAQGAWHDLGDGAGLKVARINNPAYQQLERELRRRELARIKSGRLDEETHARLMIECLAHTVLLDWRGLEVDGKPLPPYTPEEGIKMMTDTDEISRAGFRNFVISLAADADRFKIERDEELQKN